MIFYVLAFISSMIFYSISSLITLFMIDPISKGGLGFREGESFQTYATFLSLAFFAPLIGGALSDLRFGPKMTMWMGGCLSLCGVLILFLSPITYLTLGLSLVAFGYGFTKTTLTAFLNPYYSPHYRSFYMSLCFGCIVATFLAGYVYSISSFKGVLEYLIYCATFFVLSLFFVREPLLSPSSQPEESKETRDFVPLGIWLVLSIFHFMAYVQMTTSMSAYLHTHVNRELFSFEVPAVWVLESASCLITLYVLFGKKDLRHTSVAQNLFFSSLAFILLYWSIESARWTPLSFFVAYSLILFADLCFRPELLAKSLSKNPFTKKSFFIGCMYVFIGLFIKLGGYIASFVETIGYSTYFLTLAILLSIASFGARKVFAYYTTKPRLSQSELRGLQD